MTTQIKVPALGESSAEATVGRWYKSVGEAIAINEPLVELETDKVTVEVPSPVAGVLASVAAESGAEVEIGSLLGSIDEDATAAPAKAKPVPAAPAPAEPPAPPAPAKPAPAATLSPAVRKLVAENSLDPARIPATGAKGRITKGDVLAFLKVGEEKPAAAAAPPPAAKPAPAAPVFTPSADLPDRPEDPRGEERVRMSRLRKRIAERLKEA